MKKKSKTITIVNGEWQIDMITTFYLSIECPACRKTLRKHHLTGIEEGEEYNGIQECDDCGEKFRLKIPEGEC